jgi:DNA primase
MYINNVEELVEALKPRLKEYLVSKIGNEATLKSFKCYVHEDSSPSMAFNPKTGNTTVHCFGCGATHDIFSAAAHFDSLPATGPEWVTSTLPELAKLFNLTIKAGETSLADKERSKLYKLMSDVTNILAAASTETCTKYLESRGWTDEKIIIGQVPQAEVVAKLTAIGWDVHALYGTLLLGAKNPIFGEDRITFVIKDYRGRPVGFVARNLGTEGAKYVNSPESLIYEKRKILLGIDSAAVEAKRNGIYVVEGPGDLAALHRVGIYNVVATCGTAFTAEHLALLKMLGIRQIYFALDWDVAGKQAMRRVLKEELRFTTGVSTYVVAAPTSEATDVSELLEETGDYRSFTELRKIPAFEWVLTEATNSTPEDLCQEMIPIIAQDDSAIRREGFVKILSEKTGISTYAIKEDIAAIRDNKVRERNLRVQAASEKYFKDIEGDPGNATALLRNHQEDLFLIEKEFNKLPQGADYQLSRFEALETERSSPDESKCKFKFGRFTMLQEALDHGVNWTRDAFILVGGRANSGKTAFTLAVGTDICFHDPDTIVIGHFTDDSYRLIEPRIKCNIATILREEGEPALTIGKADNPKVNITNKYEWEVYARATQTVRDLIAEERLFLLDQEDGKTLTTLERTLRQLRNRYPQKKIFVMCDGIHNYRDYGNMDQTRRITKISESLKDMTSAYECAIVTTGHYRKNMPMDKTQMKLPEDDDLADARALMYDPNAIIHIYNDLHDRKDDHATIFWKDKNLPNKKRPRLLGVISKNKISDFKDKLAFDMDGETVSLRQTDIDVARFEATMEEKRADRAKSNNDDDDDDDNRRPRGGMKVQAEWD